MLTATLFFFAYAFASLPLNEELKQQIENLFNLSELDRGNSYECVNDY
jgi:hypothetical protein